VGKIAWHGLGFAGMRGGDLAHAVRPPDSVGKIATGIG
jgi:hypothetical protein